VPTLTLRCRDNPPVAGTNFCTRAVLTENFPRPEEDPEDPEEVLEDPLEELEDPEIEDTLDELEDPDAVASDPVFATNLEIDTPDCPPEVRPPCDPEAELLDWETRMYWEPREAAEPRNWEAAPEPPD